MRVAVALVASLALAGCATTPAAHLSEGRALTESAVTLDGVARSLDSLALSGQLKGQAAATARDDLAKAKAALDAAQTAYAAGNDGSAATNAATASALLGNLVVLIAGTK